MMMFFGTCCSGPSLSLLHFPSHQERGSGVFIENDCMNASPAFFLRARSSLFHEPFFHFHNFRRRCAILIRYWLALFFCIASCSFFSSSGVSFGRSIVSVSFASFPVNLNGGW